MKKLYLVLGNGFTMDIIGKLETEIKTEVDVANLFRFGDRVKWPKTNSSEFLSYKRCPNLWTLGARPNLEKEKANQIIEDIITCANVYHSSNRLSLNTEVSIYIKAYTELTMYLKYLFIHYNNIVSDEALLGVIDKIPLIKYINNKINDYDKIYIVTYNYDIFLERVLLLSGLNFSISGKSTVDEKIEIFKPHGSISFIHKVQSPKTSIFSISQDNILRSNTTIDHFELRHTDLDNDLSIVNAIIPPAGDSSKFNYEWSKSIQSLLVESVKKSNDTDEIIIFGLSYWHVDREELDTIITNFNSEANLRLINPNPPSSFVAVLTSLFMNFTLHTDSKIMEVL